MSVALFPGRFQPPHLGQIITLMRLYALFDDIIVTVSENTYQGSKSQVMPTTEVREILEEAFRHMPKIRIVLIGRGLLERDDYEGIPPFDVLVSGNPLQIEHAKNLGFKTLYYPRTKIGDVEINGSMLRGLYDGAIHPKPV